MRACRAHEQLCSVNDHRCLRYKINISINNEPKIENDKGFKLILPKSLGSASSDTISLRQRHEQGACSCIPTSDSCYGPPHPSTRAPQRPPPCVLCCLPPCLSPCVTRCPPQPHTLGSRVCHLVCCAVRRRRVL